MASANQKCGHSCQKQSDEMRTLNHINSCIFWASFTKNDLAMAKNLLSKRQLNFQVNLLASIRVEWTFRWVILKLIFDDWWLRYLQ